MFRLIKTRFFKIPPLNLRLITFLNQSRQRITLLLQRLSLLRYRSSRPIQLFNRRTNIILIHRLHLSQIMQIR
jgi:hypothetical protein